ncbi:MAG: hypothetical protein NTZ16_08090, partial [Verrucomicrobia bacterium]|nr:hypothetical protein [Verrucomicrobiota bacterium]
VGHEMRGEREAGLASLERADDVSPAARVHRADAALGLGRPDLAAFTVGAPTTIKKLEIWKLKPANQGFCEAQTNRIWEPKSN